MIGSQGRGWGRHFSVAPSRSPHARSTAAADGLSAAGKLLHHYLASSDALSPMRVTLNAVVLGDRNGPGLVATKGKMTR